MNAGARGSTARNSSSNSPEDKARTRTAKSVGAVVAFSIELSDKSAKRRNGDYGSLQQRPNKRTFFFHGKTHPF
jgi:hypothetical protein